MGKREVSQPHTRRAQWTRRKISDCFKLQTPPSECHFPCGSRKDPAPSKQGEDLYCFAARALKSMGHQAAESSSFRPKVASQLAISSPAPRNGTLHVSSTCQTRLEFRLSRESRPASLCTRTSGTVGRQILQVRRITAPG